MRWALLCLLVAASSVLFNGTHSAFPQVVVQAIAAGFGVYHLVKYRPRYKSVVIGITATQISFALAGAVTYSEDLGWVTKTTFPWTAVFDYVGIGCMAIAACALLMIRRPVHYQEGVLDFVAAVAVLSALQWEMHGRTGAAALTVLTSFIIPLVCAIICAVTVGIVVSFFKDSRTNNTVVAAQLFAVVLAGIGNVGDFYYPVETSSHPWPTALVLTGSFLLSLTFVHPDTRGAFQPEMNYGTKLSLMRWLGPVTAIATTPAMMVILLNRDMVPSAPLVLTNLALTVLVIWRIQRLLADRESARRHSELGEQRLQSLLEYAADVIVVTQEGGVITYVSPGVEAMFGLRVEEVLHSQIGLLIPDAVVAHSRAAMVNLGSFTIEVAVPHRDGTERWITVKATDHRSDSSIRGWIWNVHDISDRKAFEETMSKLALYDELTGLPNRNNLRERLDGYLHRSESNAGIALLFCDLDGFKLVNDTMGHQAGDEVLRAVAGRWSGQLRGNDILGRWGGDEFLIVCPDVDGVEVAEQLARRLVDSLTLPLELTGSSATVGASIGIITCNPGEDVDAVLARADTAMYVAKRGGASLHTA